MFHAGTATNAEGEITATGGRVLGITATSSLVREAQQKAYEVRKLLPWCLFKLDALSFIPRKLYHGTPVHRLSFVFGAVQRALCEGGNGPLFKIIAAKYASL